MKFSWKRRHPLGFECSSKGDHRFSALHAKLRDGRTIEQAYQLDVKGFRPFSDDWRYGKGKRPLRLGVDLWAEYLKLWQAWATEHPELIEELRRLAIHGILTDVFATTDVSQARALAEILNGAQSNNHRA